METTSFLTGKLDEVNEDCDKKLQHIEGLEITIKEYQKYFNDMNSKGASLDVSSENLDDSYAIAMASMPSKFIVKPFKPTFADNFVFKVATYLVRRTLAKW